MGARPPPFFCFRPATNFTALPRPWREHGPPLDAPRKPVLTRSGAERIEPVNSMLESVRGDDASAVASQDDPARKRSDRGLVCGQPQSAGLAVPARAREPARACRTAAAGAGV